MKTTLSRFVLLGACASLAGLLGACDIDKTQEGEAPSVDVDVDGGRLPRYDVDGPDVDVALREEEVTVPDVDVDVDSERRTIRVPDIDVDLPEEDDNEGAAERE